MPRKDWYYIPIKHDMALYLDYILKKKGERYGLDDRIQLVRWLIGEFIYQFDKHKDIMKARDHMDLDPPDNETVHKRISILDGS